MEFFIGIFLGSIITAFIIRVLDKIQEIKKEKELDNIIQKTFSQLKEMVVPSKIEEHNGILMLFNKETNEFLAQGKNMDELNENIKKRYPNKLFNVSQDELQHHGEK